MYNQNFVFNGLGTLTVPVPETGNYQLKCKTSLPTLSNGGGVSACLVVINDNGSPIYTGTAGDEGFEYNGYLTSGHTLTFVWTSSATSDQGLNVIKSVVSISTGV